MLLYKVLLPVLLFIPLLAGESVSLPAIKPPELVLPLLISLRSDAIELGKGPIDVYVFIDPNCPHSRDFLGMISDNQKMLSRYHYYFFLYALPHFGSSAVINAIYADASPKDAMLSYMLRHQRLTKLSRLTPPAVQAKVARIIVTAEAIGIDRRPYLILDKKKKR